METVYRVKSKIGNKVEMLFKYGLNNRIKAFEIIIPELNGAQEEWLFNFFPSNETKIKEWIKKHSDVFDITISPPDLSFEAFWAKYGLKVNKDKSQTAWNKLNQADRIKCFQALKNYDKYLTQTKQAKAHLVTWLNQKRFNDEY